MNRLKIQIQEHTACCSAPQHSRLLINKTVMPVHTKSPAFWLVWCFVLAFTSQRPQGREKSQGKHVWCSTLTLFQLLIIISSGNFLSQLWFVFLVTPNGSFLSSTCPDFPWTHINSQQWHSLWQGIPQHYVLHEDPTYFISFHPGSSDFHLTVTVLMVRDCEESILIYKVYTWFC